MNTSLLRFLVILLVLGVAAVFVTTLLDTGSADPDVAIVAEAPTAVEEQNPEQPEAEAPAASVRETAEAIDTVRMQQPDADGDFQSGSGGFSGRVLTNKTGQPIEGATVSLFVGPTMVTLNLESTLKATNLSTTTDSDGTYHFDGLPSRNDYVVAADHPEYARGHHGGISVPPND